MAGIWIEVCCGCKCVRYTMRDDVLEPKPEGEWHLASHGYCPECRRDIETKTEQERIARAKGI